MKKVVIFIALTLMVFGDVSKLDDMRFKCDMLVAQDKTKESMNCFQEVAKLGDPMSTFMVGLGYLQGKGVKKDSNKAILNFNKSSDLGFAEAQYTLGVLYMNGQGVETDKIKAYQYYMKAAKQGHANAQNNLDYLCGKSPWACK